MVCGVLHTATTEQYIGVLHTAITEKYELVMVCGVLHTAITEQYRCIAYSNHRINIGVSGGLCVLYIAVAAQHRSGVASRVIGRMGQCEECMYLQE